MRENGTRIPPIGASSRKNSGRRRNRFARSSALPADLCLLSFSSSRPPIVNRIDALSRRCSLLSRTLTAPGNANRCRSRCARRNFVARAYWNRRDLSGLIVRSTRDELSRFRDDIKELPISRGGYSSAREKGEPISFRSPLLRSRSPADEYQRRAFSHNLQGLIFDAHNVQCAPRSLSLAAVRIY